MDKLTILTTNTPMGEFHMILDSGETVRASGFGGAEDLVKRLPLELRSVELSGSTGHRYQTFIADYFSGDVNALSNIPRKQSGSEFQEQVWAAISSVGYGETISYKELANQSGNVGAIRSAASICGYNRLILLVPCHRILKSNGSVGEYLYGPNIKTQLLTHEGALA
jgi:methylated-DNA-[protein]-cysteine S-methyltransferase